MLIVWKLDRLGRSTVQLIELMETLKNKGIHLESLSESINTSTATDIVNRQQKWTV